MVKNILLLCILSLVALSGFSQSDVEKEKLRELEIQKQMEKQRLMSLRIDSAVMLLNQEEYEAADKMFISILKTIRSVPSDLTYYFGKNSFFLGKYKQSIDWLTKYIQLKGTTGQFSQEATTIKQKAETEILKERELESKQVSNLLSQDYDIDCGQTGKIVCPVCNGTTVIIKKGYISDTYKTCGYCNHSGVMSCEDYNKLLRGQLKPASN
jgi:hypothetical protein